MYEKSASLYIALRLYSRNINKAYLLYTFVFVSVVLKGVYVCVNIYACVMKVF